MAKQLIHEDFLEEHQIEAGFTYFYQNPKDKIGSEIHIFVYDTKIIVVNLNNTDGGYGKYIIDPRLEEDFLDDYGITRSQTSGQKPLAEIHNEFPLQ